MPSNDNTSRLRPLVIAGPAGPLTAFHRAPVSGVPAKGNILVVPPFAEEMNRCRSMVAMQAQALAAMGFGTLTLDLRGTGDSAGEFDEGDWEGWRADLQCGVDWLRQQGQGCSALWGIRLGALMAAEMAADDPAIDRLLLWMPVVAGKAYWTQFLRIRIAAEMADPNGVKSTEELRQRSKQGMVVEASGYPVGAALAQRLDTLAMPDGGRLAGKQVAWLEVNGDAQAPMPRANAKLIEDWRGKGVAVVAEQVVGPAFWQVHERAEAPDLILLDVMMPRKNGYEVCQEIRAEAALQGTRILMLTAKGRETEVTKGLAMGADAYMTKPFSTKELVTKVKALLDVPA